MKKDPNALMFRQLPEWIQDPIGPIRPIRLLISVLRIRISV